VNTTIMCKDNFEDWDDDDMSQDWDPEPPMPDPDPMPCGNCGELHVCHLDHSLGVYLCDSCDVILDDLRQWIYGPPPSF
jgi:hypothetical protein